jgi:hypothetical protein
MLQRIKSMPVERVVGIAALYTLIAFVGWVGLIVAVWLVFRLVGIRFDLWAAMEAISTAAAVAQIVGGGLVLLVQMNETVDSRNLDIYNNIFERLMSEENIAARRWIYINLPPDPKEGIAGLSEEGQKHVKLVLNSLDHLGFLITQDWVTSDAILKWVSPFVVKIWVKIGPYIDYEATRRGEPDYYEAVRDLAIRCVEWRRENVPGAEDITWLEDAL